MKVLYTLTPAFSPNDGGVQRVTYNVGRFFAEQGLSVHYYSLAKEGHIAAEFGELHHAPEEGGASNPANIAEMHRLLETLRPEVVINQMPYVRELREGLYRGKEQYEYLLLGCLHNSLFNFKSNVRDRMKALLPKPVYLALDNPLGIALIQQRHRWRHRKDLKAILDQHDFFVLLAPPNRDELNYFVGAYKADKVISMPNSIPRLFPDDSEKERVLLHVGRLNVPQKRSDLLAPFWERVHSALPKWRFIVVGDGPYRPQLEREIRERNLPRIQLEGYQKPGPYYRKADLFMMPSAYEGFPNTLLEAQSYGCVPLAFDSYAAIRWIVHDGRDALLAPSFDLDVMATQLIELAQDPVRLASMRSAALENAGRFTIDSVGRQWVEFFEKFASR